MIPRIISIVLRLFEIIHIRMPRTRNSPDNPTHARIHKLVETIHSLNEEPIENANANTKIK
jgi:hypothetical protein